MENVTVTQPGTVAIEQPSTVLNPHTVTQQSGGGMPSLSEPKTEDNKPQSIESVLEAESKRLKGEDAEGAKAKAEDAAKDAKPKADDTAKAEAEDKKEEAKQPKPRAEDGKFAKAEEEPKAEKGASEKTAAERVGSDERQSEGRKHAEPPARFLPEARTKWANVPNEVKAEVHRVSQEYETELQKHKTSSDRYETIRQFDETARQNGRELKDSLAKVVEVEQALARNPIAGLESILREVGPRKADGSPLTLMEVAQHVVNNPQAYQQATTQPVQQAQQHPQRDPEIDALRAELNSMKAEQTIVPLITKFAGDNPDYYALEPKIAQILGSGVIEQLYGAGLSAEQKLAEAYRMAGGQPSSRADTATVQTHSEPESARPVNPDAGKKSVRGAPSDGADTATDETETDLREMLRKEMRKIV